MLIATNIAAVQLSITFNSEVAWS